MTFSKKSIRKGDERDTDKAGGNALGPSGVSSRSENSDESCEGLGVLTWTRVLDGTKNNNRRCDPVCVYAYAELRICLNLHTASGPKKDVRPVKYQPPLSGTVSPGE